LETVELITKIENLYLSWGYPLVFISSFIETTPLGWAIPGGTILVVGGFFSYSRSVSLYIIILAGWLGQWLTFLTAYYIGFRSGMSLVKKLNQSNNVKKAKILLDKHGGTILTTSMLANLTRFWIAYVSGVQKYNILKFIFYSGVASLGWTSLMVMIGYIAGSERTKLETSLAGLGFLAWALILVALFVIYWKTKKEFKEFKGEEITDTNGG
jgi:membrane protein DedA with SNARE-associated domain